VKIHARRPYLTIGDTSTFECANLPAFPVARMSGSTQRKDIPRLAQPFLDSRRSEESETSSGLLSEFDIEPPEWTSNSKPKWAQVGGKKSTWIAGLVVCVLLLGGGILVSISGRGPPGTEKLPSPPPQDNGEIPLGQSRDINGREVFWWEQFPRYGVSTLLTCLS